MVPRGRGGQKGKEPGVEGGVPPPPLPPLPPPLPPFMGENWVKEQWGEMEEEEKVKEWGAGVVGEGVRGVGEEEEEEEEGGEGMIVGGGWREWGVEEGEVEVEEEGGWAEVKEWQEAEAEKEVG